MTALHDTLAAAFGWLLDPLRGLDPLLALSIISAVSGVILIFLFRVSSNPKKIRVARNRAQAHLLAVRLFRHDLVVVFRSQVALLGALARYLGRMGAPFLVLLVPFGLLFGHLDARYATRSLAPNEDVVVEAIVASSPHGWHLEAPDGVVVEAGPVRIPNRGELSWRIRAARAGTHRIAVVRGAHRVEKTLVASETPVGTSYRREAASLDSIFLAPAEPAIPPEAEVRSIEVHYPALEMSLAGVHLHWIVVFLAVSIVAALLLRKQVGAEF